jgi:hypothetical protein
MESDGTKTENFFHIRIHKNPRTEKYLTFVKERFSEFIVCHEQQDEDVSRDHLHIHGQAYLKFKTEKQLRSEFKKWFPSPMIHGNGDYTLKAPDSKPQPNACGYKYVCKGTSADWETGKPEILATSFSEDDIKEFHRQYWNHHDRIKVNQETYPEVLDIPKKKKEYKSWTVKTIEIWNAEHEGFIYDGTNNNHRLELTKFILKRMGKAGRALDDYIFIRTFRAFENGIESVDNDFYDKHVFHYYDLT